MIAVFLKAEIDSERWGNRLLELLDRDRRDEAILRRPNPNHADENGYRRALLDKTRGYEQRIGLFAGFPRDVDWRRASLERNEVLDIRFINWDWWLDISGGTRRPRDAARRIRAGQVTGANMDEDEKVALAAATNPELIAVTAPEAQTLVLVEGHVRLTAYALFPEHLPDELDILLGTSEQMMEWTEF